MEKIIIANLKMYMRAEETYDYLEKLNQNSNTKKVIYCPSSLYLPLFLSQGYQVGIQNISAFKEGAYTGEIAASQASSLGVQMVLVGHNECRHHFEEENALMQEKMKRAKEAGLGIVFCIGETEETEQAEEILQTQLSIIEDSILEGEASFMIAYEPVWAVGTGKIPSDEILNQRIAFIKEYLKKFQKQDDIPILYGGSVSTKNIKQLCQNKVVNGFLIGKESTDSEKLSQIIEVAVPM